MEHQLPTGYAPDHDTQTGTQFLAKMIVQIDSTDATEDEITEFCVDLRIDDPRLGQETTWTP